MQTHRSLYFATLIILTSIATSLLPKTLADESESRRPFNQNWLFHRGDYEDARFPETDDEHWRQLNLPHSSRTSEQAKSARSYALASETSWYRKRFDVPATRKGQPVSIYFEGVAGEATVWINGHQLSNNRPTQAAFYNELTPFLRYGGEPNVIAIRLQRRGAPDKAQRQLALSGNVWLQFDPPS